MSETERYADWKDGIRSELEAFEGHGPPSAEQLADVARHEAEGTASWLGDMPLNEETLETAKGDVLKALVALEMAEERSVETETNQEVEE